MSYGIYQLESRFRLRECNAGPALAAIKEMAWEEYHTGSRLVRRPRFEDETMGRIERAEYLDDALRCLGCGVDRQGDLETVTEEPEGDVIGIELHCLTLGDEDLIFATLAPFVEDDSYVTVAGEDGRMWRWLFHDGKCYRQAVSLRFDGEWEGPMLDAQAANKQVQQPHDDLNCRMLAIREAAIECGLATPDNVDRVIKALPLNEYRRLFGTFDVPKALFPEC